MQSLIQLLAISSSALLLLASFIYISIYMVTLHKPGQSTITFDVQLSPPPPLTTFGRIRNFTIATTPHDENNMLRRRTHSSIATAFLTPVLGNSPTTASGKCALIIKLFILPSVAYFQVISSSDHSFGFGRGCVSPCSTIPHLSHRIACLNLVRIECNSICLRLFSEAMYYSMLHTRCVLPRQLCHLLLSSVNANARLV